MSHGDLHFFQLPLTVNLVEIAILKGRRLFLAQPCNGSPAALAVDDASPMDATIANIELKTLLIDVSLRRRVHWRG